MKKFIYLVVIIVIALVLWSVFGSKEAAAPTDQSAAAVTATSTVEVPVGNDAGMPDTGVLPE